MKRSQKPGTRKTLSSFVGITLLLLLVCSGVWYSVLSEKADRHMSPLESEVSGNRWVGFSLRARRPVLVFEYETTGLAPTVYPYVAISFFGEIIESIPDSARLDEISASRQSS